MVRASRFTTLATVLSLTTGAFLAALFPAASARAETCDGAAGLAVLPSPLNPWKGAPLRVIFATEKPLDGEFALIAPDGSVAAKSHASGSTGRLMSGSPRWLHRPRAPGTRR